MDALIHTATLHKPHVKTHQRQEFVDTNITGTLNLLEEAVAAKVGAFIFTSTTSVFGRALTPSSGEPAAWITEELVPRPTNIYGVTKLAAEQPCELFHRDAGLPCLILRTSRFFPEPDDRKETRDAYEDANAKVNEFLYRRADIADVAYAHHLAVEKARSIGFGRYIVNASTPFSPRDLPQLRVNAPAVVRRYVPAYEEVYRARGWSIVPPNRPRPRQRTSADRLGLAAATMISPTSLFASERERSPLALAVGSKGYHEVVFDDGPYPV